MSLFDWMADKDDRIDDWPPPGADACELCGGYGRIHVEEGSQFADQYEVDNDNYMACPECDGSGWAQGDRNVN